MSVTVAVDSKKLVETLLGDLRQLSTESKRKYNHVKEAAESGIVNILNISTASNESNLIANLRTASGDLLLPLSLACATKQTKLVQIGLQGIQRFIQNRILVPSSANIVVGELWNLVDSECEELRVLQTVPPLVSADLLVTGNYLAKCIVMCFRLHFAKDPVVINAASAAIRQLVAGVFERVIQEDGLFSGELTTVVAPSGGRSSSRSAPPTLRPCAADAYMLFRDICLLVNAEPAVWLTEMREITRTLGLELIENLLKHFPSVFHKHSELAALVKHDVCQLIIKLFSPSLKQMQITSQHPASRSMSAVPASPTEKAYFPITMRLVRIVVVLISYYSQLLPTETEIFISHLLKSADSDKRGWQRQLSLEALHKISYRHDILRWMCEQFDAKGQTKLVMKIGLGFSSIIHQSFTPTQLSYDSDGKDTDLLLTGVAGFYYKSIWIPFVEQLAAKKTPYFDSLERHDSGSIPEGYAVSRTCIALCDMVQSAFAAVDSIYHREQPVCEQAEQVASSLYSSVVSGVLPGLSLLLAASSDETVTDQILCALSTLVAIGCKISDSFGPECVYVLCAASLPSAGYLGKYASIASPPRSNISDVVYDADVSTSLHQVIATSVPCPSPLVSTDLWSNQLMITSRNIQAARILFGLLSSNSSTLSNHWYLCLSTCQHLTYMLQIRPSAYGVFLKDKNDESANTNSSATVTTAANSDIPVLCSYLDKLSQSCVEFSDILLSQFLEILMRLSDEQLAVAATGKESSLFALGIILRISLLNLKRLNVFWSKVILHFTKICGHSTTLLREWSATAIATLVRQSFKIKPDIDKEGYHTTCLSPLIGLCEFPASEVKRRQLECVMAVMQTEGTQLHPTSWPVVIQIVSSIVSQENCCDEVLVRQGYLGIRLISADFLQSLPFNALSNLVEAITLYGKQTADQNISLSALALLWTISDFVYRKSEIVGLDASEDVWLVLYTCLSELCVDGRHSVRKSACQTMLQTVAAHGHALRSCTWHHMVWKILMPLIDRVRTKTLNASTEKSSSSLIMHHSRDTEQKQWTETCIHILSAFSKMYNSQRKTLLDIDDFGAAWEALLSSLEWGVSYENAELSLCGLKCFQEVLLGRVSAQTLDINTRDRSQSQPESIGTLDHTPQLPLAQWIESWNTWNRMARSLTKSVEPIPSSKTNYVAGPSHLTTLLHTFPPLFERVAKHIPIDELRFDHLPSVLDGVAKVPIPLEQAPFVLTSSATQLTPTQEAILDSVKAVFLECVAHNSRLRDVIPDQIRLLLGFSSLATNPVARVIPSGKNLKDWSIQYILPFAEASMRLAVDFYSSTCSFNEVIDSLVIVDLVKYLAEPLYLKYSCMQISTWKLASSSLISVMKVSIPLARQPGEKFVTLWDPLCDTLEKFLFTPNICTKLAADERKRDELIECQVIDLIRIEILPFSSSIPPMAVQRLISLLNRGSISQMDPNDVLALDSHTQRSEFARTCFDALLSTSNDCDTQLGSVAISSLLQRCSQVIVEFARDWGSSGDLQLPRTRLAEMISALQAIDELISKLSREPGLVELYSQLVSLYPSVVDVVPSCRSDGQLQAQLITTLKSFQTLLLLKAVPNFNS